MDTPTRSLQTLCLYDQSDALEVINSQCFSDCDRDMPIVAKQTLEELCRLFRTTILEAIHHSSSLFNDDWITNPLYSFTLEVLSNRILWNSMGLYQRQNRSDVIDHIRKKKLAIHAAFYTKDCPLEILQFLMNSPLVETVDECVDGNMGLHIALKHVKKEYVNILIHDFIKIDSFAFHEIDSCGMLPLERMFARGIIKISSSEFQKSDLSSRLSREQRMNDMIFWIVIFQHPLAIIKCIECNCMSHSFLSDVLAKLPFDSKFSLIHGAPYLCDVF